MSNMYRQGDLLFIETDRIGDDSTLLNTKDILGSSVTGHIHRITEGKVYDHTPTLDDNANFYVWIPKEGAAVVHEEHGPIDLPAGKYKVIRQREVNGYVED